MSERDTDDLNRRVRAESRPHAVRFVGFWLAIFLPALYFPLLFRGLETLSELLVFFVLLSVNLVVLFVGRTYQA